MDKLFLTVLKVSITSSYVILFVWLSFILMSKDMEMSCDETVVKELGSKIKKEYSMSLLLFATDKNKVGIAPIAFGEGEVKSRVKNVLNYKKPSFWVVLVSVIALITVAIGFMFNPINNEESNKYLEDNNLKGISLLERGYDEPDKVIHLTN